MVWMWHLCCRTRLSLVFSCALSIPAALYSEVAPHTLGLWALAAWGAGQTSKGEFELLELAAKAGTDQGGLLGFFCHQQSHLTYYC